MTGLEFIKRKDTTFKLKILLIHAFIKSDIPNSLRIDKIIEKPIFRKCNRRSTKINNKNKLDSYIFFSLYSNKT